MKKIKRIRLQWHITERCNWHCKHCYQNEKFIKSELTLKEMLKVFRSFVRLGDKLSIPFPLLGMSFTGGEPFIRQDFEEFLEKISPYKNRVLFAIYTNGSFLTEKKLIKLRDKIGIRSIQLSVEGPEDINDSIRGKGTYRLIKEKIKLLNKLHINAQLSLTILKTNINKIPQVFADFADCRVRFNIRRFVPIGRGEQIKKLMPSPHEIKKLYQAIELRKNSPPPINIIRGCEEGIFAVSSFSGQRLDHCHVFHKGPIVVMPNGDVYPCRRLPIKIGNVKENDLGDIYLNSKIYNKISNKKINNKKCLECEFFDRCWGGSRCIAYAYYNNKSFSNIDPQCFKLFYELPQS